MPKKMGRPPLPAGEARQDMNVRLHPLTLKQLDEMSVWLKQPRARIIERAVAELYPNIVTEDW